MQVKYQKGQRYVNTSGRKFTLSGIWFLRDMITAVELTPDNSEDEFYYRLQDFENAILENKITEI